MNTATQIETWIKNDLFFRFFNANFLNTALFSKVDIKKRTCGRSDVGENMLSDPETAPKAPANQACFAFLEVAKDV